MYRLPHFQINKNNETQTAILSLESINLLIGISSRVFTNSTFPHFPAAISFVFYTQDK
jgi:hypothetical protein